MGGDHVESRRGGNSHSVRRQDPDPSVHGPGSGLPTEEKVSTLKLQIYCSYSYCYHNHCYLFQSIFINRCN